MPVKPGRRISDGKGEKTIRLDDTGASNIPLHGHTADVDAAGYGISTETQGHRHVIVDSDDVAMRPDLGEGTQHKHPISAYIRQTTEA